MLIEAPYHYFSSVIPSLMVRRARPCGALKPNCQPLLNLDVKMVDWFNKIVGRLVL